MSIGVQQIELQRQSKIFQNLVNWFVFFMVFPCIDLFDNSITFYFFLYFLLHLGLFWRKKFFAKPFLFGLIVIVVLSSMFAPYAEMPRYKGFFHTFQIDTQYLYWILTTCFFIIYRRQLDMVELSRYIFYGIICFTIGFFLVDLRFDFGIGVFGSKASRNAYVFNMLCSVPLSFYYLKKQFSTRRLGYFLMAYLLIVLLTNGRSGGIIIIIETLMISAIVFPTWLKVLKRLIIPLIAVYFIFQSDSFQPILFQFAERISAINPRLADLLTGSTSEGNLKMDRSWLERKLQVEKGLEIVHDHPIFGVGPGNFSSYDARMSNLYSYERLANYGKDYYNQRSAHNSYILMMGEFGIPGFMIFMILLGLSLFNLFWRIYFGTINEMHLPLVSLMGMAMHFYAIVAITGAITWFTLGMALSVTTYGLRKWS